MKRILSNQIDSEKTHFQVPNDIAQSADNVRHSDPRQSVIENKIDIKCIQVHL